MLIVGSAQSQISIGYSIGVFGENLKIDSYSNPLAITSKTCIQVTNGVAKFLITGKGVYLNACAVKETEIKLTNVARASLEELKIDYEDFLRTNKLNCWDKEHRLTLRLRELNRTPDANYETFKRGIENDSPEICANVMIGLIKVVSYLLFKQIRAQEQAFLKEGGFREKMFQARKDFRNKD